MDKDFFRIGAAGIGKVRKTNKLALLGAGTLLVIILFYIILNLSTNYHKLDDFEDYVEEYNEGKHFSKFEQINVGIKIMPSYNLEKNVLYMRQSKEPTKSIIGGSSSLAQSYQIKPPFFRTNQTRKVFPTFSFNTESVPLGNSIALCVGVHWGAIERGKHYSIMKEVKGFDKCSSANDVFIWNEDDSQYGIDVPAWKQIVHEVDCSDEDCAKHCKEKFGGAFVNGVNKHVCYSYETLDSICIIIKYDKLRDEYVYHGGCFPGNQTYKMNPAALGEENKFNAVKIEIRDYSDPIVQAGEWTDYGYNFGQFWRYVSIVLKILTLAALGLLGYVAYDIYVTRKKYKGAPNDLIGGEEDKGMPGGNIGFSM